jgi:hypothetical protein
MAGNQQAPDDWDLVAAMRGIESGEGRRRGVMSMRDRGKNMCENARVGWFLFVVVVWSLAAASADAAQTIYPNKDGTLADGGVYGPFDGVADNADWYFNESSYEGSITLATQTPESSLEHRVVWEYNLSSVSLTPPVSATFFFTIRGAPVYPRPDVDVHVYSYPADLVESMSDFSSGPTELQGSVTLSPYQPATEFSLDVSDLVSEALSTGSDKVAFRFQVDPGTPSDVNQAFMDALDSDPTTKPYLVIDAAPVPGDTDGDGDVDLDDFASFPSCMAGPEVDVGTNCEKFDFDEDLDVDLADFALFQSYFGL